MIWSCWIWAVVGCTRQINFDDNPCSFCTCSLLIFGWSRLAMAVISWISWPSWLACLAIMVAFFGVDSVVYLLLLCRNCASKALHQFLGLNVRVDVELAWVMTELFSEFPEAQILSCLTSCQPKAWTLCVNTISNTASSDIQSLVYQPLIHLIQWPSKRQRQLPFRRRAESWWPCRGSVPWL